MFEFRVDLEACGSLEAVRKPYASGLVASLKAVGRFV